jgi:hypothetical protein
MRITSFAVPAHPPFGGELVERWVEAIETAAAHAPAVVGHGASSEEAIDDVEWRDGDVLVVGSSSAAPAARVFLGSRRGSSVTHPSRSSSSHARRARSASDARSSQARL